MNARIYIGVLILSSLTPCGSAAESADGAHVISFYGYEDCLRLENETTRVTLCPAAGGRVLQYSWKGKEALYLPKGNEGWIYRPGQEQGSMDAGRFDIGPEQTIPPHPQLWMGRWTAKITGPRSARMIRCSIDPRICPRQSVISTGLQADHYQHLSTQSGVLSLEPHLRMGGRDLQYSLDAAKPFPARLCDVRSRSEYQLPA